MSIQRWSVARSELCPVGEEAIEIVTYADHVAAVAEAEQLARRSERAIEREKWMVVDHEHREESYLVGYAAGLDAARDAVAALPDWKFCDAVCGTDRSVVAAIDALRGES